LESRSGDLKSQQKGKGLKMAGDPEFSLGNRSNNEEKSHQVGWKSKRRLEEIIVGSTNSRLIT
jgi:hypothetical protein